MENLDDILPYLKLRDGEEILFTKRFEGDFPIRWLAKYHEPETFPEHLIAIKKDRYIYDQIDIITNFRLIQFGINYNYMEEDRVTPISEIFHHENLFLWVNLEDIIDYKIDFGINVGGVMGFKFFGKGRLKVKEKPLHFTDYNYEEYCQIKDIVVKLLKFERQEIDKEEDKKIQKIIEKNKVMFFAMFIGLIILGSKIIDLIIPIDTQDPIRSFLHYSLGGLYVVYMLFFLLLNIITIRILLKKYKTKTFFTLMKIDFAWYLGPAFSAVFFALGFGILILETALLTFIDNELLALSITIGFWTIIMILAVVVDLHYRKKKKSKTKKTTDKEV